jgi:hypothetical protein
MRSGRSIRPRPWPAAALVVTLLLWGAACSSGASPARGPQPTEPVTTTTVARPGKVVLQARLSGRAVVPGPGAASGSGTAKLTLDAGASEVCFELTVRSIDPASDAAVFTGPAGAIGPSTVALDPPAGGSSEGCVHVDPGIIQSITDHPNGFYISVRNVQFPGGALRAQLST